MTTKQIYDLAVSLGTKADFRSPALVKKYLERVKKKYDNLSAEEKACFDKEKLVNPYSDTRILVDNKKKTIKKILTGIDIDTGEVLLADRLGADLIISHHPAGPALNDLHSVMDMQVDMYAQLGVPINVADFMLRSRQQEVSRRFMPLNSMRAVDSSRIMKMDFLCTHTVCDNLAARFVDQEIKRKKPEYVEDILKILSLIPEYKEARRINDGPAIACGDKDNHCGRVVVSEFTGGTNFTKEIYANMLQAGVGTIISMHMKDEYLEEAKKNRINVIIAGHMASDSLGMNLFLDQVEKKGVEVVPCSGLIRIRRGKR